MRAHNSHPLPKLGMELKPELDSTDPDTAGRLSGYWGRILGECHPFESSRCRCARGRHRPAGGRCLRLVVRLLLQRTLCLKVNLLLTLRSLRAGHAPSGQGLIHCQGSTLEVASESQGHWGLVALTSVRVLLKQGVGGSLNLQSASMVCANLRRSWTFLGISCCPIVLQHCPGDYQGWANWYGAGIIPDDALPCPFAGWWSPHLPQI